MNKKSYLMILLINFFALANYTVLAMEVFTHSEEEETNELSEVDIENQKINDICRQEIRSSFYELLSNQTSGLEFRKIYLNGVSRNLSEFYNACGRQEQTIKAVASANCISLIDLPLTYCTIAEKELFNCGHKDLLSSYYGALFKHIPTETKMENGSTLRKFLITKAEAIQKNGSNVFLPSFVGLIKIIDDAAKKER